MSLRKLLGSLGRAFGAGASAGSEPPPREESAPEGWTDDLSLSVAPGYDLEDLVDFILESETQRLPESALFEVLTMRFGLTYDDARLALDRVGGGRARAPNPANEPDARKDPIAHITYRRMRGAAAPRARPVASPIWQELLTTIRSQELPGGIDAAEAVVRSEESSAPEREAAGLWIKAVEARGGTAGATSAAAAAKLLELAAALEGTPCKPHVRSNVLLQTGTAIWAVGEARIAELGPRRCAPAGTPAWFDGILLGEAAGELSRISRAAGDVEGEGRALELRGRIVTTLLGQCRERVGTVMLDSVRYFIRVGERERAASHCEAVISDFEAVVDECEASPEAPVVEDRIALGQLREALDVLVMLRGESASSSALRARCSALLDRI